MAAFVGSHIDENAFYPARYSVSITAYWDLAATVIVNSRIRLFKRTQTGKIRWLA